MLLRRIIKNINWSDFLNLHRHHSLLYKSKWINTRSSLASLNSYKPEDFKPKNLSSSSSSSTTQNHNSSNELDVIEEFNEEEEEIEIKSFCLKNILYPNSNDALIQELNCCNTFSDIFKMFSNKKNDFQTHHIVQSVILMWNFKNFQNEIVDRNAIISSNNFEDFLQCLYKHIDKMNIDELTCCFLYLNKLGVDISHLSMRKLLQEILDRISDLDAHIPLTALSRLTVGVSICQDLYIFLVCQNVLPHIIKCIEKCRTAEEIRLITICMYHLHRMIDKETLEIYKEKVSKLLHSGAINNQTTKCLLKVINLLNLPHWSNNCTDLIRRLALTLADQKDENFSPKEIEGMFRLFQSHLEPASFIPKLLNLAEEHFKQTPTPELLACLSYFSKPTQRNQIIEIAKELIENPKNYSQSNTIASLFVILRSLKISDLYICNTYWTNTLNAILTNPNERLNYKLARHCYRYMYFNNNLGGTYRHKNFEAQISEILLNELTMNISSMIPSKVAKFSSFLLAYGYKSNTLPPIIMNKIEEMSEQFTIIDCLQLSRGLQIAFEMRCRNYISPESAQEFLRIENVLNAYAERHLERDLNLIDLNLLIRSLTIRKASRKTHHYKVAIEKYKTIQNDVINSRLIRNISFNLICSGYLIPEIIDKMFNYIIKNKEYISGDTVEKIISCSYNLGYIPENENALHWSAEIIKRDFEFMAGLSIIQACLALCFYKVLPESLVNKVFNIEFIRRLEEEIQSCYSKTTYPNRVLQQMMQLNRAVCLDFPELQVPWFQQNYIEAQMSKKPVVQTRFHTEIKKMLTFILQEEKFFQCNHVTPYGYIIDFVIYFDKNRKPILPPPKESGILDRMTKVAILLLKLDSFCQNDNSSMRGHEHLRMRHLEMLGYKVIHINLSEWNSMYMNVPGAKVNYLKGLLQIE